ncbi:hypothetical protein ES703_120464 [subsurface metagenome]
MAKKGTELIPTNIKTKIDTYFAQGLQRLRADKTEELRGMFGSVARARFKEGLTTEDQYASELRILNYPEEDIPRYLAGGRLEYALDLFRDLLGAWRDAVRKGNIGIDVYGQRLSELGLVPERVATYMLREVARLKPGETPGVIAPPKPFFETDAGKLEVDTVRRARRKLLISRDREIAALLELGMPVYQAEAAADNDDIRLAEKAAEE